jgi:hypothetical protein
VLRHNEVWRAKRNLSASFSRARHHAARSQPDGTPRRNKSVRRSALAFMTPTQAHQPVQLQMKPVRQCVRRAAVEFTVAQASPLFSDHAPREVHLWQ